MTYYPINSNIFFSITACIVTTWLYRVRATPYTKSASQALLLGHSLFLLYLIFVVPPRNVFSETGYHANTSSDTLRLSYLNNSPDGALDPSLDRVLRRLNSFDMRLLYLQLGHDTVADCDFCHSWQEYVSFTLVRSIFAFVLEIAFVGAFTLPKSPRAHLRSFGIGILMVALVAEVVATASAAEFIAPKGMENPLITRWHDTIYLARSVLFLALPLGLHMPRIPIIYSIPVLNNFLPYPDPRSSVPRTTERLKTLQATLDTLIPRLHLLSYTRAAIMRTPTARDRATKWWSVEREEGTAAVQDEGLQKTAKGIGMGYIEEKEGDVPKLLQNVRNGIDTIFSSVPPSQHWLKQGVPPS